MTLAEMHRDMDEISKIYFYLLARGESHAEHARRKYRERMQESEISNAQMRTLAILEDGEGWPTREILDEFWKTCKTRNKPYKERYLWHLDKLEKLGLVVSYRSPQGGVCWKKAAPEGRVSEAGLFDSPKASPSERFNDEMSRL